MKKSSHKLHELIHSMSMNEKRYFKISAAGNVSGQNSHYLKIFDIVARQKKYNEDEIKNSLDAQAKKDLPVIKNYLYKLILKKLCSYNAPSTIEIQLHEQLNEAFVLFQKGLYVHYDQMLKKIKTAATKYGKLELLLEIYNRELKLVHFREDLSAMENKYKLLLKEYADVIQHIQNRNEYYSLKNNVYLLLRKTGVSQNKQTKNKYSQLMQSPLLTKEDRALSQESKLCYYDILSSYYVFGKPVPEKALHALESKYQLLRSLPYKNNEVLISYTKTLTNLAIAYHSSHNIKKSFEQIRLLEECMKEWEKALPQSINSKHAFSLHSLKSSLLIDIGSFREALKEIQFEEKLLDLNYSSNNFNFHYYKKAISFFAMNQFRESLLSINTLLNSSALQEQDKFYRKTKFLQLLIYTEMEKTDLIEHEAIAIKRFYKKAGYISKTEKMAFDFILNFLTADLSHRQFIDECIRFKKQLDTMAKTPHEKTAIDGFDFETWLESKIHSRSFAEIVQEKAKLFQK